MATSLAPNDKDLAYHPQRFPAVLAELWSVIQNVPNVLVPKTCLHSSASADINKRLLRCGFHFRQNSQLKEEGEPLERLSSSPYSAAMLGWLVRLPG